MLDQKTNEIVFEFAKKISNPLAVKQIDLERTKNTNHSEQILWDDLSLVNGYPGILILCTLLEQIGYLSGDIAHRYVVEIKKTLENQGTHNLSLFTGFAGICFAIDEASHGKTRYVPFLRSVQSYLLNKIKQQFLDPLLSNLQKGEPRPALLYDVISGICGIGRYALENLDSPSFSDLSEQIAKILIQFTLPITVQSQSVPGWYVSPTDILNQNKFDKTQPNGNFNVGLAHGITGVLSYLAIAYLKGMRLERQRETIELLSFWIQSKSFSDQDGIYWPYAVSLEEQLEGTQKDLKIIKAGWCYGVPGIARTLFLAGKALKNEELKRFAMHAFVQLISKPQEAWRLPGPCLCHGVAGLVAVTEAMSQEPEGKALQPKIIELKQLLMNHYQHESVWGFMDIEENVDQKGKYRVDKFHKIGYLDGAIGIFLTLLPLKKTSKWHLPLMIYE